MPIYTYYCSCETIDLLRGVDERDDPTTCPDCLEPMRRKSVYRQTSHFSRFGGTKAAEEGVYESGLAQFAGDPRARVQTKKERNELLDSMKRKADEDGVPWRVTRATDTQVGEGATQNKTNTQVAIDAFKAAKYSGENQ